MKYSRILPALLLVLVAASEAQAEREEFTGTTTVLVVEVPVNVIQDGEPVRGLTVEGGDVLAGLEGESMRSELFVYALDRQGEVRDFFTRTIEVDASQIEERLGQGGDLKFYGDLYLDPGDYDLRILVRAGAGALYALRSVPLTVADLSETETVLLEPVFFDDPSRPSIVVREADPLYSPATVPTRYPFRVGEGHYFPAVRPALAADRPARISLMAYGIKDLLLQASVVRGDGSEVDESHLSVAGKDAHDGLEQVFFDLRPAGLEPGDYTFRVALVNPWTQAVYRSSASFRLVR